MSTSQHTEGFGERPLESLQNKVANKSINTLKESDSPWTNLQIGKTLDQAWNQEFAEQSTPASTRASTTESVRPKFVKSSFCPEDFQSLMSAVKFPKDEASDSDSDSGMGSDIESERLKDIPESPKSNPSPKTRKKIVAENKSFAKDLQKEHAAEQAAEKTPRVGRRRSNAIAETSLNLEQDKKGAKLQEPNGKTLFDTFTIRTWFMSADKDNKGFVTKREFISFLIGRPDLMKLLVKSSDLGEAEGERNLEWHVRRAAETEVQRQARVQRRLLGFYKTIDVDRNRCLDFQEFLALFQQAGCVLEYCSTSNPRELAADVLASVQGTGPIQDKAAVSHRARRGSEDLWARDQKAEFNITSKLPARRHSSAGTQGLPSLGCHNSPASFWGQTVVLGTPRRRQSWSGKASDCVAASMPCF
jgi:hypothetical protein